MDPVRTLDDVRITALEAIQKAIKTKDFSPIYTLIEKLEEITLSEKYLQHKGVRCPVCGSPNLTPGRISSNVEPHCYVECENCDTTFQEIYTLDRIEHVNVTSKGRKYLSQLKGTPNAAKS